MFLNESVTSNPSIGIIAISGFTAKHYSFLHFISNASSDQEVSMETNKGHTDLNFLGNQIVLLDLNF